MSDVLCLTNMSLMGAVVKKLYLKEDNKTRISYAVDKAIYKIRKFLRENEILSWTLKILSLTAVIFAIWGIFNCYNSYEICRNYCNAYYAQVGVEFKRRQNLIPNLDLYVNEYGIYENEIMTHTADARQIIPGSDNTKPKIDAAKQIEGTLSKLLAIVEQYPELKSIEIKQVTLKEISNTENRIVNWKNKYNKGARDFNDLFTTFPTNFLGYLFREKGPIPYIVTDEDLLKVSLVNFSELTAK